MIQLSGFEKILLGFLLGVFFVAVVGYLFYPVDFDKDYFDARFDRVEIGLVNATRDVCFENQGKWISDGNGFATIIINGQRILPCILPG